MTADRQSHLDALRGIAGLVVVLVHFLSAFYPYSIFGLQGSYQQLQAWEDLFFYPPIGLIVAGNPAVCLFFILSGYVLSYSHLGRSGRASRLIAAIIKRPIRLGGLVWATIIISALIWHLGWYFNSEVAGLSNSRPWFSFYWYGPFDFHGFLMDFFTSSFSRGWWYNAPLWTVEIELYGSILVYLFLLLFCNLRYRWLLCLALIIATSTSYYQGFWIGMMIADLVKHQRLPVGTRVWLPLILFALATFFACDPHFVTPDFRSTGTMYGFLPSDHGLDTGYSMLSATLLFLSVVMSVQLQRTLKHPILQYYGRISYALYVVHFIILGSLSSWMFLQIHQYLSYGTSFVIVFVVSVAIITGVAELGTRWVDDPSIKISHYLERKISSWYKPISRMVSRTPSA
ncbi:MAG: acyltransferase [Pseudomonadota bacterium]